MAKLADGVWRNWRTDWRQVPAPHARSAHDRRAGVKRSDGFPPTGTRVTRRPLGLGDEKQ